MKNSKKNILVNFHVGRGGRFNNAGYLTFVGTGNEAKNFVENENYIDYENKHSIIKEHGDIVIDLMTDLDTAIDGEDYDAFCKKYGKLGGLTLYDCSGNEIGDYKDNDEEYHYDEDGICDTSYGKLIDCWEDLTDSEQYSVRKSSQLYILEYDIEVPVLEED